MANVVEEGAAPSSNIVAGAPAATKTFTMPASVGLDVQSVVATIDNSAGATPVTATVTIRDQGGEVIDANAQDDTIPAGGSGTATFARRLVGKGGGIRFGRINTGTWLDVRTTDTEPPGHNSIRFNAFENFAVTSGREINFDAFGGTDFNVSTGNDINLFPNNDANIQALDNVNISADNFTNVQGVTRLTFQGGPCQFTNSQLAFFSASPVSQQATPATLGQVIALLQAYGLCP